MKARGVLETILYGSDLPVMKRFYEEVLGLVYLRGTEDRSALFRCGNQMVLIFDPAITSIQTLDKDMPIPAHGAIGSGHICFRATREEIDQWRGHLVENGVEIESEFEWPRGGYSLYFRDPAGNSVEFAEPRIWGIEE